MQSESPFFGEDLGRVVRRSHDLDPFLDSDATRTVLGILHFFRVSVRIQPAGWSQTDRRHPRMRSQSKCFVAIGFTTLIKYKVLTFLHWWWTNITRWIQQEPSCLTPFSTLLRRRMLQPPWIFLHHQPRSCQVSIFVLWYNKLEFFIQPSLTRRKIRRFNEKNDTLHSSSMTRRQSRRYWWYTCVIGQSEDVS